MQVTVKAGQIQLNSGKRIKQNLDAVAMATMKNAAKGFLDEVVTRVPVLTGEALGSVLPVARILDNMSAIMAKLSEAGGRLDHPSELPNKIAQGEAQGNPHTEDEMFSRNGDSWVFTFSTDVFHFFLRDNFAMPNGRPTPWHAFKEGRERMVATLRGRSGFKAMVRRYLKPILGPKVVGLKAKFSSETTLSEDEITFVETGFSPERD